MKKILRILTIAAVLLTTAIVFASCKQFLEDPEEFLGYWSSEVVPIDFSIDKPYQMSNDGALCIPSATDVILTIKLRNPRKFSLVTPTPTSSAADVQKIINFPGLSTQPTYGTHYTLEQTPDKTALKLTYKPGFLKDHEWGMGNISPEITLTSTDGRPFNKKFSLNLRADTAPSLEYKGVGKIREGTKWYHVLIFQAKNMGDEATSGHYVHKDITKLHITTEGGVADYTVDDIDFEAKKIKWKTSDPFLDGATQLVTGEYEGTPPSFPASTDKWLIYFKTDVEVSPSSALKTYEAWLSDEAGLVSNKVQGSTCIRKIGEIQVTATPSALSGTGTNSSPYEISCNGDGVKLGVWCQTPIDSVKIRYWVTNLGTNNIESSGDGTASPTTPLQGIKLLAPSAIGSTIKYEVRFKADKPGFASNEKTVYYKLTRKLGPEIDGSKPDAWAKLKYAVEHETEPVITIKNEIKAKDGSTTIGGQSINNDEQITVTRHVKINGFDENAVINADSKCRIFSVTSGTLKLNGLTLKKGKAQAGANGGGVYVSNSGTAELSGCAIENCTADLGGGIGALGNIKLTNTSIKTCEATSTTKGGGGVYAKGCTLTMENGAKVVGNKARNGSGGGIYAEGAVVNITNCTLRGNSTPMSSYTAFGGAIYAKKDSGTVSIVTISGGTIGGTGTNDANKASNGAGICVGEDCILTLKEYTDGSGAKHGVQLIGNDSNFSGGGVYAEGAVVSITNCTFKGNSTSGSGGAIYADKKDNKPSTVTISGGAIGGMGTDDGNKTTSDGGGVYAYGATVNITNCTLKGNTAMSGGAIYAAKPISSSDTAKVTVSGNTIIGGTGTNDKNKATGDGSYESGGGIWVGAECELTLEGNVQVIGNWAKKNGSGVYVQNANTVFKMKGSAKIDVNSNDVYLEKYNGGAKITVEAPLSLSGGDKAARITVPDNDYYVGRKVLDGTSVAITQTYKKFMVTPKGYTPWYVGSDGRLTTVQPLP